MNVHFFQPPPKQSAGGLDAAIGSLRAAVEKCGIEVDDKMPDPGKGHVVHFHGLWQPAHSPLARRCIEQGTPYVVSPHGMLEPWAYRHKWWKKWPYFHLVEKFYLRHASCLLATAAGEADRLRALIPGARVEVLPLGLTGTATPAYGRARTELGWSAQERVLLFLSRIHPKKGLDLLLAALRNFPAPCPLRLVIVGGGDPAYVKSLKTFAEKNGQTLPPVEWLGEIWGEDRWKYFQGADLFCLPSHSENFGLAVLEALQVGTPVLTTRTTPWASELGDGRGFIGDPTEASVRRMLNDFCLAPSVSDADRQKVAAWARISFSWKALGPRYADFYRSVARR